MSEKNLYSMVVAIVVLVVIVLTFVYIQNRKATIRGNTTLEQEAEAARQKKALEDSAAKVNPFNSGTSVNPFSNQQQTLNPYENIKTNPFE